MWSMLVVIAACGLLGVFSIMVPTRVFDERVYIGAFTAGLHALGVMVLVAVGKQQPRSTAIGVTCLALSAAIFLTITLFDNAIGWQTEEALSKSGGVLLIAALVVGHRMVVSPLMTRTPSALGTVLRRTALVSAPVAAALIVYPIFNDTLDGTGELLLRVFGIALVVAACSTLALGVVALLMRPPGDDEPGVLGERVLVSLTCPRCRSPIETRSGRETRCDACRLSVTVKVEEPRCTCGYNLYQLESDTCPECGRAVDPEDRWGREGQEA